MCTELRQSLEDASKRMPSIIFIHELKFENLNQINICFNNDTSPLNTCAVFRGTSFPLAVYLRTS